MKARLISVLLVIALLITVGVVAAQAADSGFDCEYYQCPNTAAVEAQPITNQSIGTGLTGGHWYLAEDLTTTLTIASGNNCIHLNGHSIKVSDGLAIDVLGGKLHVNGNDEVVAGNCTDSTKDASTVYGGGEIDLLGGNYQRTGSSTLPVVRAKGVSRYYAPTTIKASSTLIDLRTSATTAIAGGNLGYVHTTKSVTLNLTGAPKIARLRLYVPASSSGTNAAVVQRISKSELSKGAEVYIDWTPNTPFSSNMAEGTVTGQIQYYKSYDPRMEIVAKIPSNSSYGTTVQFHCLAFDWSNHECVTCGEAKSWTELTAAGGTLEAGGHYYVKAGTKLTAACQVASGTVCVDLNGYNLSNESGLVFDVAAGATLNVNNGCGLEAVVTGANTSNGATIINAGTLNLNGGKFKHTGETRTIYTTGTMNINAGTVLTSDEGVVGGNLYIAGGSVTMNAGTISNGTAEAGGNVYKYDGTFTMKGGEIIDGTATSTETDSRQYKGGGNILSYQNATTIQGGTISGGNATLGGNMFVRLGTITLKDTAVIKDGHATNAGGNLYNRASTNFKVECTVQNGSSKYGGNLYSFGGTVRVGAGANIQGGTASATGGSIYTNGGTFRVSGSTDTKISGGTASGNGGTFYFTGTTVQLLNGKITGGTANNGGLMAVISGTVQIGGEFPGVVDGVFDGGTFTGGKASAAGGQIYVYGGTLDIYDGTFTQAASLDAENLTKVATNGAVISTEGGTTTIYGGTFTGGFADQFGGLGYLLGGVLDIQGGSFNSGLGETEGDTIYVRKGEIKLQGGTFNVSSADTSRAAVYLGGTQDKKDTPTDYSDDVYYLPKMTIGKQGATVVNENNCTDAIAINALSALHINSDYTGTMNIVIAGIASPYYGETIINNNEANATQTYADMGVMGTCDGNYDGTLLLMKADCPAILPDGNGGLVVAGAQVDGQWVAADAVTNGTNVKLYADATMTLKDGANSGLVDLNGKNLVVNGTGTFDGFNSSTAKASQVTLNGVTTEDKTTWNDAAGYYNVVLGGEEGVYTYHKLDVKISAIALRTKAKGLYYRSQVNTDDDLRSQITYAGIFLGVPTGDETTITMATAMKKITNFFGNDVEKTYDSENSGFYNATITIGPDFDWTTKYITSVLVENIFKTSFTNEVNRVRGEAPIVGVPYVVLGEDTVLTAQSHVEKSMQDYMEMVDQVVNDTTKITNAQKQDLLGFYHDWMQSGFDGWNLPNLREAYVDYQAPADPVE